MAAAAAAAPTPASAPRPSSTGPSSTGPSPRECGDCEQSEEECWSGRSTRRRVCVLLALAALSLLSIVLISERLIARHLLDYSASLTSAKESEGVAIEVDIVRLRTEQATISVPPSIARESLQRLRGITLVQDGIYWSDTLEHKLLLPDLNRVEDQVLRLRDALVQEVRPADRLHCGRGSNRRVVLQPHQQGGQEELDDPVLAQVAEGVHACARGGDEVAIRDEILAFHLAKTLAITNVPAVVLSELSSGQWSSTWSERSSSSSWWRSSSGVVSLTQWVPSLRRSPMPRLLAETLSSSNASLGVTMEWAAERMANTDVLSLLQLMHFTDLILFDYLTANYDRVAILQESATRRRKALRETVPNIGLSDESKLLWMIDNEAAFETGFEQQQRFFHLQRRALESICIFRRDTINNLRDLATQQNPLRTIINESLRNEPLLAKLPPVNPTLERQFQLRVNQTLKWVDECQQKVNQLLHHADHNAS